MALATYNFTTGPSHLPGEGQLVYNGCRFSPLFSTTLSGKVVRDAANRTTKYMEYILTADGYVTLPTGRADVNSTTSDLRKLLTVHGATLIYKGRGFDLVINSLGAGGGGGGGITSITVTRDVAWGPAPELIEFQPLGAGRSAKVKWQVTIRVPEIAKGGQGLLQLNYETTVSYNEDYFSTISIRGTLEVPITRAQPGNPTKQGARVLTYTVDDFRNVLEARILKGIDAERFRVTRRQFAISRDKRTLEWEFQAEERPYMDLPPDCTLAYGTYSVRPTVVGAGLAAWMCTLRATYVVRAGAWRRLAWLSFLALLWLRMDQGNAYPDSLPKVEEGGEEEDPSLIRRVGRAFGDFFTFVPGKKLMERLFNERKGERKPTNRVWLMDFTIDEGLYRDSKSISFSATWRLLCNFSYILLASGVWVKVPEEDTRGRNLWAISMRNAGRDEGYAPTDITGTRSWLANQLDPNLDIIVDFGGPDVL